MNIHATDPIHPTYCADGSVEYYGVSFRQWLAGKTLPAVIIATQGLNDFSPDDAAKETLQYVDALITALGGSLE